MKSYTTPKNLPLGPIMCDLDGLEFGAYELETNNINWRSSFPSLPSLFSLLLSFPKDSNSFPLKS